MCTVKFYLDTRSNKPKKTVLIRVNHDGSSLKKSTRVKVKEEDWDFNSQFPRDKTSHEFSELAKMEKFILDEYQTFKENFNRKPNILEIRSTVTSFFDLGIDDNYIIDPSISTVSGLTKNFIENRKNAYSDSSISHYEKLRQHVLDKFDCTSEAIQNVDKSWGISFISYLCEKGYQNSTIEMYLKKMLSVFRFHDIETPFKISDVMSGLKKSKNVNEPKPYLTFDQLKDITKFVEENYEGESIEDDTWNVFLFGCYTGARYNELMCMRRSMIKDYILTYSTTKNEKSISVPLNRTSYIIAQIYQERGEEWLLPQIHNTVLNRILTKILTDYGLTQKRTVIRYSGKNREEKDKTLAQLITFHSSRHSFASNLIDNGMSVQEVADLMGVSVATLLSWYSHSNKDERNRKALEILNK